MTAFVREHCVSLTVPHPGLGVLPVPSANSPSFLLPVWADPTSPKFHLLAPVRDLVSSLLGTRFGMQEECASLCAEGVRYPPSSLLEGKAISQPLSGLCHPCLGRSSLVMSGTAHARFTPCPERQLAEHLTSLSFQFFMGTEFIVCHPNSGSRCVLASRTFRGMIMRMSVAKRWSAYLTGFIMGPSAVLKRDFSSKMYEYWLLLGYPKL